jgi:hypothetical protein
MRRQGGWLRLPRPGDRRSSSDLEAVKANPRRCESYAHEDGVPVRPRYVMVGARASVWKAWRGRGCGVLSDQRGVWSLRPARVVSFPLLPSLPEPSLPAPAPALEEWRLQPPLQRAKLLGNSAFGDVQLRCRDFPRSEAAHRLETGEHSEWGPVILNHVSPPLGGFAPGKFWPRNAAKKSLAFPEHSVHL